MNAAASVKSPKLVTELPYRLEAFGGIGWTVAKFSDSSDAADFFRANSAAAMPCWRRMDVVDGQLVLAR